MKGKCVVILGYKLQYTPTNQLNEKRKNTFKPYFTSVYISRYILLTKIKLIPEL